MAHSSGLTQGHGLGGGGDTGWRGLDLPSEGESAKPGSWLPSLWIPSGNSRGGDNNTNDIRNTTNLLNLVLCQALF